MNCETCAAWMRIDTNGKPHGQCRSRPPQVVAVDNLRCGEDELPMRIMARWPLTSPHDWRLEWERRGDD